MSDRMSAVSFRGDRTYKAALAHLADERGEDVGDMVREAIDEKFGAELKPLILFFAERGSKNGHLNVEKSNDHA